MKKSKGIFAALTLAVFMLTSATGYAQDKDGKGEIKIQTSAVCGMCKDRIEEGLAYEAGIKSADLDLSTKIVTVVFNPSKTDESKIKLAISNMGYDAGDMKANADAYAKLPACCKKTGSNKCSH